MPNGELTAEQKSRITQNFRAAKARLARKRPPNDAALPDHSLPHKILDANGFVTPLRRVPLADVSNNTTTPFTENNFSSSTYHDKFSGNSENGAVLGSCFSTPKKQPEPYTLSHTSSSISFPSILDDDFDDSILAEIDALVEQVSAAKAERTSLNSEPLVGLQHSGSSCGISNTSFEPWKANKVIKSEGVFELEKDVECKAEELDNSTSVQKIENMPEEFSKYLLSLNDRQREAACSEISIPLMIVAGPGSGKTSTMVGRILMLINEGISPSNILAMTFTTAAASEMRDRIGKVTGKARAKELTISTFHSFSLQLCRSHAEKIGRTSDFIIYGHVQQRRAITEAVRLLENDKSSKNLDNLVGGEESNGTCLQYCKDMSKKWQKLVTQAKASGKTPADYCKMGDELGAIILGNYNNILKSCNALDYHDMINCSVKLLTDFPEVFKECQELWRAIVIDEFQDTSAMQYKLLKMLASHNHITIVGDDDQSIFSFNGADISGFHSFRSDFPNFKEVRLNKNYRSTRHIVEAASFVIRNNTKRCHLKSVDTDNFSGSKIIVKECHNEDAQCSFIVDKIFEMISVSSDDKSSFGDIAILYRRQVSGKVFQTTFRERKIPFNIHGVAFYRKKVVQVITAMLSTVLPDCDDGSYRRVFKALLSFEKDEKKRVIEHIEKILIVRKCSFISAARDIFNAKVSGTFKRSQLTQGRKVLLTLEMISKLVHREGSVTAVITSVANMVPQGYLLEQRAVIDVDGGKLLNEDNDMRSVLQYLLDDVSDFLSTKFVAEKEEGEIVKEKGCLNLIKAFVDHVSERERENFRSRRQDNENSVTLTTIHQSKGLEWNIVFIIKANESEIPLLHETRGVAMENAALVEEERRLFYVAMTRARTKLFVLYVTTDSNFQILRPSRFLKEIPDHLREVQAELSIQDLQARSNDCHHGTANLTINLPQKVHGSEADMVTSDSTHDKMHKDLELMESVEASNGNYFLRRFSVEERSIVSHLFHQWAKKPAFQDPKRLVNKVGFVIDERLRVKNKHKDVLRSLKSCLQCDEAFFYAEYVLRWEKIPADQRAQLMREKQEHFQKLRIETSMGSSAPTSKQISYLQKLGCTVAPTSRLHASRLIEQYKSL